MSADTIHAGVKAGRKVSATDARRRGDYEVTDFGRKRRSRVPKALRWLVVLLAVPFAFVAKWRVRLHASLGRAGRPDPRTAAGRAAASLDRRSAAAVPAAPPQAPHNT